VGSLDLPNQTDQPDRTRPARDANATRDPTISNKERGELKEFQKEVSSWIQVPDGAADIPNYRKEGF
jgi:hypothetical protein